MAQPERKLLTYEDLLAVDAEGRYELVDGDIEERASPRFAHSRGARKLGAKLDPVDPDDSDAPGWWILIEPDVVFSPHRVFRPDLAGWRRERLPDLPDHSAVNVVPDWVCEIVTPGGEDERRDTVKKRRIYAEEGVGWYWLVRPEAGTIEVLELLDGTWKLHGIWAEGDTVALLPFPELTLDVGTLFLTKRKQR